MLLISRNPTEIHKKMNKNTICSICRIFRVVSPVFPQFPRIFPTVFSAPAAAPVLLRTLDASAVELRQALAAELLPAPREMAKAMAIFHGE